MIRLRLRRRDFSGYISCLIGLGILSSCASTPPSPEWIKQSARTVDNGYIVYVGTGQDRLLEKARFNAESEAIGDLVNECSFAPKGARIEDHFEETTDKKQIKAYAKIGISFDECEQAKKATSPEEIKQLANVPMTEQLKRYQEMIGSEPEPDDGSRYAQGGGGVLVVHDTPSYFYVRQQVAWQKQYVILAPPGTYAPGSPEFIRYNTVVTQVTPQLRTYEVANPTLRTMPNTWAAYRPAPVFRSQMQPRYAPRMAPRRLPPRRILPRRKRRVY